jgi:ATP-dependent RNA helicase DeaD
MVETSDTSFDHFFLSKEMLKALSAVGYERPTPVQAESIPLILAGIDLIVQSQTGSGKTAAFAVPTTEMLDPHPGRVEVLVLAPTRELAKQVAKEFESLGQYKELAATAIYGGASYEEQYKALETAQIVSATPGRLLDLAKRGSIDLSNLRILCLDEADEMLSMGFREELNAIVEFLPEERQSLLFSATVNEEIKALAKGMLYYPEYISLSGDQVAAEAVTHLYYRVKGMGRQHDLVRVLKYERPDSAIIFCNTRDDTFTVTKYLQEHGYRAKVLNGDLPQKQREATLGEMREGKVDFIVATDVAARGIDITDLSHVINYALPSSAETYVHRTGRTGRAGKTGRAISLVSPAEMATHFDIMSMYDIDIAHRELPSDQEVEQVQIGERLATLTERVMAMEDVPFEATMELAAELLAGDAAVQADSDADKDEQLRNLLAKLLAMADMVLRDSKVADIVTGRAAPAAKPARKPAPKPAPKTAPRQEKAPEAAKKRAPKKEAPTPETKEAEKAEKAAATPTPESSERPRRRRRRSRGSKGAAEAAGRKGAAREGAAKPSKAKKRSTGAKRRKKSSTSGAKRRKSAGKRSESRSSRKRSRSDRSRSRGGKRRSRNGKSSKAQSSTPQAAPEFSTSKMYMNVGRDHVENAKELLDMICYMSGFAPEDFGDVSVQSSYSFVQVRDEYFYDIINAMNNQEWNGVSLSAEPARK